MNTNLTSDGKTNQHASVVFSPNAQTLEIKTLTVRLIAIFLLPEVETVVSTAVHAGDINNCYLQSVRRVCCRPLHYYRRVADHPTPLVSVLKSRRRSRMKSSVAIRSISRPEKRPDFSGATTYNCMINCATHCTVKYDFLFFFFWFFFSFAFSFVLNMFIEGRSSSDNILITICQRVILQQTAGNDFRRRSFISATRRVERVFRLTT